MELIQELGIEYYPQNIEGRYLPFLHTVENSEIYSHFFLLTLGTKIMQVGNKSPIRTYNSQIPSIGTLRGLIDLQRYSEINFCDFKMHYVEISGFFCRSDFT